MIFSRQFCVEKAQKPVVRRGRNTEDPQAGMSKQFSEEKVVMADPPVVETHGEAKKLHSAVCQEGNDGNVEDLLLAVGVEGEQWVGVFGEVVSAVVFPKAVELMHDSVVPAVLSASGLWTANFDLQYSPVKVKV